MSSVAGPHSDINEAMLREMSESGWEDVELDEEGSDGHLDGPSDVYDGLMGPSATAERAAREGMLGLFFYFLPKSLWKEIAFQSNLYEFRSRPARIRERTKKIKASAMDDDERRRRIAAMKKELESFSEIKPREICAFIGLLIARVLSPQRRKLADHWRMETVGAVGEGTFGRFMKRKRFEEVKQFLHFTDSKHKNAKADRAWKIRSVVSAITETFKKGYELGRFCAFDEMVIPSRSSFNGVRVFMKNKPHKYGTKLFALCCSKTSYCNK